MWVRYIVRLNLIFLPCESLYCSKNPSLTHTLERFTQTEDLRLFGSASILPTAPAGVTLGMTQRAATGSIRISLDLILGDRVPWSEPELSAIKIIFTISSPKINHHYHMGLKTTVKLYFRWFVVTKFYIKQIHSNTVQRQGRMVKKNFMHTEKRNSWKLNNKTSYLSSTADRAWVGRLAASRTPRLDGAPADRTACSKRMTHHSLRKPVLTNKKSRIEYASLEEGRRHHRVETTKTGQRSVRFHQSQSKQRKQASFSK